MSDETTAEHVVADILSTESPVAVMGAVQEGRRNTDWRALFTLAGEVSIFFWIFGMFLDDRKKPSMSRLMLAFWTWVGYRMVWHELQLTLQQPALQNAVWSSWWAAEGVLTLAVFGPSVASYFGPGAAGTVAMTAIGSATRDVRQIMAARKDATEAGESGTEYDK